MLDLWAPGARAREWLLLVLALSNEVELMDGESRGSPTERALVEAALAEVDVARLRRERRASRSGLASPGLPVSSPSTGGTTASSR